MEALPPQKILPVVDLNANQRPPRFILGGLPVEVKNVDLGVEPTLPSSSSSVQPFAPGAGINHLNQPILHGYNNYQNSLNPTTGNIGWNSRFENGTIGINSLGSINYPKMSQPVYPSLASQKRNFGGIDLFGDMNSPLSFVERNNPKENTKQNSFINITAPALGNIGGSNIGVIPAPTTRKPRGNLRETDTTLNLGAAGKQSFSTPIPQNTRFDSSFVERPNSAQQNTNVSEVIVGLILTGTGVVVIYFVAKISINAASQVSAFLTSLTTTNLIGSISTGIVTNLLYDSLKQMYWNWRQNSTK